MKSVPRSNGKKPHLLALLFLSGALLSLSATAQDAPPNIEEMQNQFNLENGISPEGPETSVEDEDNYGLATYDKSRTQFDGVTSEMQVTYLNLGLEQGVEIPILSTSQRDINMDFTVMLWFKVDKDFYTKSVPGGVPPQIMYLFSFEDSVACFFTDTLTLMCDSWDRRKLQIPANQVQPGIWYHMTLSSSAEGESFLLIQDSHKRIAQDTVFNFGFRQNTMYGWKCCIGDCTADYGFFGGVREVLLLSKTITMEEAERGKNLILTYESSIKAYFRFQDLHNKFEKDEFTDWPWISFKNQPSLVQDYIGVDIIPNDVCPSLFNQINTLRLTGFNQLDDYTIEQKLQQTEYAYTMSLTLMLNETACTSSDPAIAADDCNLVQLEGVFMLYLAQRNTGRFHFFAAKNYYESASQYFFLPYDQWITIQLTIEHYEGYTIVISDQNGNSFFRRRVVQNMEEQWPTQKLTLLRAFDGYVENFYLTNTLQALSPSYAENFRDDIVALINMKFTDDYFTGDSFVNTGLERSQFVLSGAKTMVNVFFQVPSEGGNVVGTFQDTEKVFDGIACNDRHMTTHLDSQDSYISFMTPPLKEWSPQNTVEFWFKIKDPKVYQQNVLLFSMVSNENNPQLYYHIYIADGALKCAPFGIESFKDPIVTFTDFNLQNQDTYGWWHISCSYAFDQTAKGTLYNTNVKQTLEETMVQLPKFYPTNSLIASFGKQQADGFVYPGATGILVKEFRYWNKQRSQAEIENTRYRQLDPTKLDPDLLLVYLRMATGSSHIDNFAARNPAYTFVDFNLQLDGLSFVEDFIETEKYSYDSELDLVVSQRLRTYHTVCPVHAYYMNQYCYNEPVNQAILAIFPHWNDQTLQLNWEMTLVHSSVIDQGVIQFLTDSWSSDDSILDDYFQSSTSSLDHLVPSNIMRHESEYVINAELTNDELTFRNNVQVKFSPSKCKWFTVTDESVSQGYKILEVSPATDDITFQLELKRNAQLDCTSFDFFDSFSGLDFEFIMTDTADYISYIPKLTMRAYDPNQPDKEIFYGDSAPTNLVIDVVIPAAEQAKLPVFQDIMIMMTVRWASTESDNIALTSDIVFQNLLYTIKFEPVANVLYADLVASQSDVTRTETLILDASNSYISNMPITQQRRSLAYIWTCPPVFEQYCQTKAGSQLAIPYADVEKLNIQYETFYLFAVEVIWAKPDGKDERSELSVAVTWYNLQMPEFQIDYKAEQTLITSPENALFYLEALNFAIDEIYDYDVKWSIVPELENPDNLSVLSGGRVMQIIAGSFSKNTQYIVELEVTHKKLDKLRQVRSVSFETLAPPVGGNVVVQPLQGFVGDEFTVTLKDWTSANLPIEYNVYSTFDSNGDRKGLIINESGPIPVSEAFTFEATRTTPLIVSVFDASGETLEFKLNVDIQLPPEPEPEPEEEQSSGDGADTASQEGSSSSGEAGVDGEESSADLPSPQNLILQISQTTSLSQRVNYMQIAIETVQKIDANSGLTDVNVQEQIEFRSQLLDEVEKQVTEIEQREGDDPLFMPTRDFLIESFEITAKLTMQPQYLDQDIIDRTTQVIYRLQQLEDNLFDLVLEAEKDVRANFLTTLENLNKFARINSVERTLLYVRSALEETMDKFCRYVSLPEVYTYESEASELGFSLLKFDQQTALQAKRGSLSALDASYNYNTFTTYNWFTASPPGDLCTQVYGQNFGTVDMRGAYIINSKARLQVTVYETGSGIRNSMGTLSGQTVATFDLDRSIYHSNQTVCMGYMKSEEKWTSDLCISELNVQDVSMTCKCNAFESNQIGIFTDFTREVGEAVVFPEIVVEQIDTVLAAVPNDIDPAMATTSSSSSGVSSDSAVVSQIKDIDGTNYVWMGQTILIAILSLAGSLISHKMDKKDEAKQSITRTQPIAAAKQNHFIDAVAQELQEPYASVSFRKTSIMHYRTIFSKSAFPHLLSQMHPVLSPFTSYHATQGRLFRFSLYMLQVNIISGFIYIYYSSVYRLNDEQRNSDVIDQSDIVSVILTTAFCSVLLTPWLSEPLIKACSNQIVASVSPNSENITQPVLVKQRRKKLRVGLMVLSMLTSAVLPLTAILASASVPASNQYFMSTTVIGSIFAATLGTNLIYLWINSCLARRVAYAPNKKKASAFNCLAHYRAVQIVKDMKAVCEVKDQFTLADVHPSSLECSERDVCSHHSSNMSVQQPSQNNSMNLKQLPGLNDKTVNDEENQVEIINEMERQTIEVVREEKKELLMTDQMDNSQRSLNQQPSNHPSLEFVNEDSQKNLIASMLKESFVDLDNSRNDVVPQRTLMDEEQDEDYTKPCPLSQNKDLELSPSRSESEHSQVSGRFRQQDSLSQDEDNEEDNEANEINVGRRVHHNASESNIPLNVAGGPKVIMQ